VVPLPARHRERTAFHDAFHGRQCGVCGRSLGDRMVLLLRLSDLPQRCGYEPALHPQCAAYTTAAGPMVNGRLRRYRSTPHRLDATLVPSPDADARRGEPAEPGSPCGCPGIGLSSTMATWQRPSPA
jgi:hypothetical protein